ncbi:MAG: hypothetical protein AAF399_10770 [Bacteroidota bacterium]
MTQEEKAEFIESTNTLEVFGLYYGQKIEAIFHVDTQEIEFDGEFLSPSAAAGKAKERLGALGSSSTNGWLFWRFEDTKTGKDSFINDLRRDS